MVLGTAAPPSIVPRAEIGLQQWELNDTQGLLLCPQHPCRWALRPFSRTEKLKLWKPLAWVPPACCMWLSCSLEPCSVSSQIQTPFWKVLLAWWPRGGQVPSSACDINPVLLVEAVRIRDQPVPVWWNFLMLALKAMSQDPPWSPASQDDCHPLVALATRTQELSSCT